MDQRVLNQLWQLTELEKKQQDTTRFFNDIPTEAISPQEHSNSVQMIPVLNDYFFKNKNIYISKHNRFAAYPEHQHTFLEMNYMLHGSCREIINGEPVLLKRGDLVLLDNKSRHAIGYLNQDDILINILFRDQNINLNMLTELTRSRSLLYDFLISRVVGTQQNNHVIFFPSQENLDVQETLQKIIEEYFLDRPFANTILEAYLSVLLTQLVRNYPIKDQTYGASKNQQLVIQILKDIAKEYASITLKQVARRYNYNSNYLSNLFKQEMGQSFSEILTQERLIRAHKMIATTTIPITSIIQTVGISNKTFFYKKYRLLYHHLPNNDRV